MQRTTRETIQTKLSIKEREVAIQINVKWPEEDDRELARVSQRNKRAQL